MVKRIDLKAIVKDDVVQSRIHFDGLVEIEKYEEKDIPKDKTVLEEHSFDELLDGITEIADALWQLVKGLFKVSKWAIILIVEGVRYLWKGGVGMKKDKKDKDKENKR